MSPYVLHTAGSWDKEIHPTTPKIQNNTTQKEAEKKKENPAYQTNFHGSGISGPQLQAQAYCLL